MSDIIPPTVTVRIGEHEIDISYACEFNCDTHEIELPDNLPGGMEVYVDGQYLCTTAVSLAERSEHMARMSKGPGKRNVLSVAIGAALYG